MVLVSVRDDKSLYFFHVFLEICEIRYHDIDSEHLILRERKTAVYDEYLIVTLNECAVLSYFFHSAKRDDPEWRPDLFFILLYRLSGGFRPPLIIILIPCHNGEAAI